MTAAEPPDETDSTKTTSPWRRLAPGWTLFDSLWGAEHRDAAETDTESNGHAAVPPDEAGSTTTTSPWHRLGPGWTLFDSPWGSERRDAAQTDPERNGHAAAPSPAAEGEAAPSPRAAAADAAGPAVYDAPADGGVVATPTPTSTPEVEGTEASPTRTVPVVDDAAAAASAATSVSPQAETDVGTALDAPAESHVGDVVTTGAPAEDEHDDATVTAPTAVEDTNSSAATADGEAPAAPPGGASRDSELDGVPVLAAAVAADVSADVEASADTIATSAKPDAVEQPKRARHAKHATPWGRVGQVIALIVLACVLSCVGIGVVALVQGTWAINPVLSGSMRPGIAVGGVVISERVPVDQLALRDVIVFQDPLTPSEQIVHRIVGITVAHNGERLFLTQGDANVSRDPWQLRIPGATVYRMRWSVPLLGYVAIAYENHRGIALILAGVLLILVAISTVARARRRKVPEEPPAA